MAFDGIVTGAIVHELKEKLVGQRIDKIYQQEKDEILLLIRKNKLLISSSGSIPRIYLTTSSKENPVSAPMFCMVMRKHLVGARINDVLQFGNDRVIRIDFDAKNDFSEVVQKSLIVEIMGKHSNIILVDDEDIIIDSIKHVSEAMSRVRQVLPHLPYEYIDPVDKLDPKSVQYEEILELLNNVEGSKVISNFLFSSFVGFSKGIGIEICERANVDPSYPTSAISNSDKTSIAKAAFDLIGEIRSNSYVNKVYSDEEKIIDFHSIELKSLSGCEETTFDSTSEMLDFVYGKMDLDDRLGQKSQSIRKLISGKLSKLKSKQVNLESDLDESKDREQFKVYADLLSANLHQITTGMKSIVLNDFYSENYDEINIPLDIKLSGPQNAQRYYKRYAKLKNAELEVSKQIEETEGEIEYLESIMSSILLTESVQDIEDIKSELVEQGYIKRNQKKGISRKKAEQSIKEYEFEGFKILLGRNNKENDKITFKIANRNDLWLHAKNIPGSHVLIQNGGREIPDSVLQYAAEIAAYNSKGRKSGNIEIDFTEKMYVKRHPANKPGLVNYTDFKTIFVDSGKEH